MPPPMSVPHVVAFYAALLTLGYLVLALRVIRARHAARVALGTGGSEALERAVRVHGNFAEYVPLALLLLALAELTAVPAWALHAAGLALLGGRALHARGVARTDEDLRLRTAGMALTFAVLAGLALVLLARGLLLAG
jgi:uncharacterized membrane protein YecN with MAPEG domain